MLKTNKEDKIFLELSDCLKNILSENSEVEQCLAVQALGYMPPDKSIKLLIEHLRNPDEDVRCDVGKSLAILKDKRAIKPLIENIIEDPVGEAKVIYIQTLQALKAYEGADILFALVNSRGKKENVAWEEDNSGWDDWLDVQIAAMNALGAFGENIDVKKAIKAILFVLDDPEGQDIWAIAVNNLVLFGNAGIKALINLMSEASSLNRKRIIMAIGNSDLSESEILLKTAMKDPDINVRMVAIISGAKRNLNQICTLGLGDGSADVRVKTLQEYKNLKNKTLAKALNDISPKVQKAACEAILRDKKPRPILKLENHAQKLLRKDTKENLSIMIEAMAIAQPNIAAEFIEDIIKNSATPKKARIASFKALGELKSSNSVAILSNACSDENQEIRLAAIGSLGKIAKGKGDLANKALAVLASAIKGTLVVMPENWQPEKENIVDFDKHKNLKQEERDQDSRKVKLDREGNIIDVSKKPKIKENIEAEIVEEKKLAPISTLDAIMATNVGVPTKEDNIELGEADIEFLEMSNAKLKKRKRINPINSIPAHIDVRRLAALVACETGKSELLEPLLKALKDSDKELCQAAIDGLLVLAKNNVDISPAQRILLRHATTGEIDLSYRAIRALAYIDVSIVTKVLVKLTNEKNDIVRAEAIKALNGRDVDINLVDLCVNAQRQTRAAAAEMISYSESKIAVPALFAFAHIEDGVHKNMAAKFLRKHENNAFDIIIELLKDEKPQKRFIGLNVLNVMLLK